MKATTTEMILFTLGFTGHNNTVFSIDSTRFCETLEITKRTLNQRLRNLRNEGYIKRGKNDGLFDHILTEKGVEEYHRLLKEIEQLKLHPELHGVPKIFRMRFILQQVRKPSLMIMLIRVAVRKERSDVIELVSNDIHQGLLLKDQALLKEMNPIEGSIPHDLDRSIRNMTFIGSDPTAPKADIAIDSIGKNIQEAENLRRRGKDIESLELYRSVLKMDVLDIGSWICSVVGVIQCVKSIEGDVSALSLCDSVLDDPMLISPHRAYVLKTKADILSNIERYDLANKVYNTALGITRSKRLECLQGMILNNMGVNHFRSGEKDKAEKAWRTARRYCKAHNLLWTKVLSEINLADIEGIKGNHRKARNLLRNAREFMERVGDIEGVSEVDFNLALVSITEGKRDRALFYFRRLEEFPLMYQTKINERRNVIMERFEEKGWIFDHPVSL